MNRNELLTKVAAINVWTQGDQRAPHKPLLILLALGRAANIGHSPLPYDEIEDGLRNLIKEFGPYRRQYNPIYPFWRLQNDGLWEVYSAISEAKIGPGGEPPVAWMRTAFGRFPPEMTEVIINDPTVIDTIVEEVLGSHFPETLHEDILAAVGLTLGEPSTARLPRDPTFRDRIMVAYEYRCAMCGWDLNLGHHPVGLEAAHIKWRQARGPDIEGNGLALCVAHHKLFDCGAFTVDLNSSKILVSELLFGSDSHRENVLLRYHGEELAKPQRDEDRPKSEYILWHQREVFKGRARNL